MNWLKDALAPIPDPPPTYQTSQQPLTFRQQSTDMSWQRIVAQAIVTGAGMLARGLSKHYGEALKQAAAGDGRAAAAAARKATLELRPVRKTMAIEEAWSVLDLPTSSTPEEVTDACRPGLPVVLQAWPGWFTQGRPGGRMSQDVFPPFSRQCYDRTVPTAF